MCVTDSFTCVTRLIHMSVCVPLRMWPDSLIVHVCHRLIHMCDTTHSYECVCALKNVTWLTHCSCASQTHSHVWHDSFIWECVPWRMWHDSLIIHVRHRLIRMCVRALNDDVFKGRRFTSLSSNVWHDSFLRVCVPLRTMSFCVYVCHDSCIIHVCHMTHLHVRVCP